jgi:hypothetical protein
VIDFKDDQQKQLFKEAMKESLNEWLDKQFAVLGKWTVFGILSMALVAMTYVYINFSFIKK